MSRSGDRVATALEDRALKSVERRLYLLVFGEGPPATHPLPSMGKVTIGRGSDCNIQIDIPSVSRSHAILHIGPQLRFEDLSSANGGRVRDQPVEPGKPV